MRRLLIALAILTSTTVQAQSPTYQRGDNVRVRDVAKPAVLKIVGIPNDRIRSDDAGIVNSNRDQLLLFIHAS